MGVFGIDGVVYGDSLLYTDPRCYPWAVWRLGGDGAVDCDIRAKIYNLTKNFCWGDCVCGVGHR